MYDYRLYIDESGDHGYKHAGDIINRYLGLTGVLIDKRIYDTIFQSQLEALKRAYFFYDIDRPPILVRQQIRKREGLFSVLEDHNTNSKWEYSLLNYFASLVPYTLTFTVVIDKEEHFKKYPIDTFNPYDYSLEVLLWRVRGYLNIHNKQSDVIAESRGPVEDKQLKEVYCRLRTIGPKNKRYGAAEEYKKVFPAKTLVVKKKYENLAGLQIADLIAAGQKLLTIEENGRPLPRPLSKFTKQINSTIEPMINRYGRYLLK